MEKEILKHLCVDELVFYSFRYFLGRMTILTTDFAERLARVYPHLSEEIQRFIANELSEAFDRDDRARQEGSKYRALGMDCDRAAWEEVREAIRKTQP